MSGGWFDNFVWARLNSDALFLALLAMGSSLFSFLGRYQHDTTLALGHPPLTLYLTMFGYFCGGAILLYALLRAHIASEIIARSILIAGAVVTVFRDGIIFGWANSDVASDIVLVLILITTTILRTTALFSKHGVSFVIPATRPEEDES